MGWWLPVARAPGVAGALWGLRLVWGGSPSRWGGVAPARGIGHLPGDEDKLRPGQAISPPAGEGAGSGLLWGTVVRQGCRDGPRPG